MSDNTFRLVSVEDLGDRFRLHVEIQHMVEITKDALRHFCIAGVRMTDPGPPKVDDSDPTRDA